MTNRCPECGDPYVEKRRGTKTTIPEGVAYCHRSVELAGGGSIGKWYIHE